MENKKIIKVAIFKPGTPKDKVLTSNGDYILDNIVISCTTKENLITGDYITDLNVFIDEKGLYKEIQEEAILKLKMDYGDEIFEISKVTKGKTNVKAIARQITIQRTLDMWLTDVRPTDKSGQSTLTILKNNSIGNKDIEFFSDIDTINTAYYMDMNIYTALHNCDQSFMNRWGGEILRRGYTVTINKRIGADRGVQIRSGKNLTGFEAKTDIDKVVTRIVAKGFDTIRAKNFIDSPLINKYSSIKTKEIKYNNIKVKNQNNPEEGFNTLEEAQAELERLAKLEFSQNHIDELRAEYNINYIQLEKTEEYKNFVQAERTHLGDTVNVFEDKHNINIHVRCIEKSYDVKKQKVLSMKLTNTDIKQKSITTTDILAELNSIIKNTENNNVQDIIQSMINSGIKDSYVIPRQNEIIIADNKDLDLAMNVVRLNKNGLAFSQDGYYGTYRYGFMSNGVINASLMTIGILSAISIQNADGSLQIDLAGRDGIEFLKNGIRAIEIAGQVMKFFDWDGIGDPVAEIFSARLGGDENKPGLMIGNTKEGFVSIGYRDEHNPKTYPKYMLFDIHNLSGEAPYPIMIYENMCLNSRCLYLDQYDNKGIYSSATQNFILRSKKSFIFVDQNNKSIFEIDPINKKINIFNDAVYSYLPIGNKYNKIDNSSNDSNKMLLGGNYKTTIGAWNDSNSLDGKIEVSGNLIESFSHWDFNNWTLRNAYIESPRISIKENNSRTKSVLEKRIVETITPNTEYIGEGEVINGTCKIDLNLPMQGIGSQYYVQLTPIGKNKKVELIEKTNSYFIVEGDDCKFDYLLKVKHPKKPSRLKTRETKNNIIKAKEHKTSEFSKEQTKLPYWMLYTKNKMI
ncbi:MAG: phage tail protein [Paeniclostridium sordellii]|nr:phage tail protein [Paeniclostridium sordellii]